jgi:hypothetical protein
MKPYFTLSNLRFEIVSHYNETTKTANGSMCDTYDSIRRNCPPMLGVSRNRANILPFVGPFPTDIRPDWLRDLQGYRNETAYEILYWSLTVHLMEVNHGLRPESRRKDLDVMNEVEETTKREFHRFADTFLEALPRGEVVEVTGEQVIAWFYAGTFTLNGFENVASRHLGTVEVAR